MADVEGIKVQPTFQGPCQLGSQYLMQIYDIFYYRELRLSYVTACWVAPSHHAMSTEAPGK